MRYHDEKGKYRGSTSLTCYSEFESQYLTPTFLEKHEKSCRRILLKYIVRNDMFPTTKVEKEVKNIYSRGLVSVTIKVGVCDLERE